ncbi:MAG TPA: hypothetical protein VJV75_06685 [Candidatus Polarisedimenticolia bacterium]|nr:hypothetical protein [Candidatus Polarisedimenticolia bacterium]
MAAAIAFALLALAAPAAAAPKVDPIPEAALEHPPSTLLAQVPTLAGLLRAGDCDLDELRRSIDREKDAAVARQEADYGPADPAATTPARKRLIDSAAAIEGDCLDALDMDAVMRRTVDPELEAMRHELHGVHDDFNAAFSDCPANPDGGGKSPACTRTLYAKASLRGATVTNQHLKVADAEFAEAVRRATACLEKRERLVRDARAAGVTGPGVATILGPLTRAWAVPPLVAERYTRICRDVKEAVQTDIPKPR